MNICYKIQLLRSSAKQERTVSSCCREGGWCGGYWSWTKPSLVLWDTEPPQQGVLHPNVVEGLSHTEHLPWEQTVKPQDLSSSHPFPSQTLSVVGEYCIPHLCVTRIYSLAVADLSPPSDTFPAQITPLKLLQRNSSPHLWDSLTSGTLVLIQHKHVLAQTIWHWNDVVELAQSCWTWRW